MMWIQYRTEQIKLNQNVHKKYSSTLELYSGYKKMWYKNDNMK